MPGQDDRTATIDQEVPGFRHQDLFMSRTDTRGIIRSANGTFQRLSGHDWSDLLGAPHRVIRHPDMPRGLFHLFWARLQSGHPIGAYVKNRAKDGRYYWVYAVALPVEDGFVSVRLKPSSPLLDTTRGIYATLRRRELDEGLSPKDSAQALQDMLAGQGFKTYDAAMAAAIRAELAARARELGRPDDAVLNGLGDLRATIDRVDGELASVRAMFEDIRGTPTNLRIQASRFGDAAVPIQIISQNYDQLTREIEVAIDRMTDTFDRLHEVMDEDSFAWAAAAFLDEALRAFQKERDLPGQLSMAREAEFLRPHTEGGQARGDFMLQRTNALVSNIRQLQRIVSGLAVTRVMCRIEAAALSGDAGGIAEIINRLLSFQTRVMASIERIEAECRLALRTTEQLVASFKDARARPVTADAPP